MLKKERLINETVITIGACFNWFPVICATPEKKRINAIK